VHAPLPLLILDLSHWIALMNAAMADKLVGMTWLRQAHEDLHVLIDEDEHELKEADCNTKAVETYL
jgi:hypothetical protein